MSPFCWIVCGNCEEKFIVNMAFMSQSDRHCVVSAIKCEVGYKNCHKPLWEGKRMGKWKKEQSIYVYILLATTSIFCPFFFNITFKNHSLYNVDVHNFPLPWALNGIQVIQLGIMSFFCTFDASFMSEHCLLHKWML